VGIVNGAAVRVCQPSCNPIAWLVLPFAVMLLMEAVSESQLFVRPITDAEGQDEYCSAGYSVAPATGAVFVVSKFWSRSVTQPFHVLCAFGVQILPCETQFDWFLYVVLLHFPLTASQRSQRIQL